MAVVVDATLVAALKDRLAFWEQREATLRLQLQGRTRALNRATSAHARATDEHEQARETVSQIKAAMAAVGYDPDVPS